MANDSAPETPLPRLHLVTDGVVLLDEEFLPAASALLAEFGSRVALHLRAPGTGGAELYRAASRLGHEVLINDRVDVALAADAAGVQLGRRSVPVPIARGLIGRGRRIGYSAHAAEEASGAAREGADFVVLGNIYRTRSHPGREGRGTSFVREVSEHLGVPAIAIGGITPGRVPAVIAAGAYGVAVLGGVWKSDVAPRAAVEEYLAALEA